ncbi:MAG: helix-turn-helix domain-containing protein [Candidatus Hydrothermarchaeales archaeon]
MLEATIAVRIPDFVGDISKKHNAMVKIWGCVPFSKTGARSLLEVRASEEKIPGVMKDFKASHGFSEVEMAQTGKDKMLATVSTTKCAICSTMAGSGCFLISAKAKGDFLHWTVLASSNDQIKNLIQRMKDNAMDAKLLSIKDISSKEELTKRQEDILRISLEKGYFDYPKRTSIRELAGLFGISISTLSEILRTGQKKVLISHFNEV